MVYKQRYYKEITHADGKIIRIEFWQGGSNSIAEAVELGPVLQSLNLEIQSGGDIDQPIVKTQLNFTLIDAPDHELSKAKKCGSWEEFYSPNATAWLVIVAAKKAGETGFKNIWGGYITPDSFRESLTYRAGVSFIARDNIGHMQDFPFDAEGNAEGMIKLRELIELAWEKIASPMLLTIETNNAQWLQTYGHNALNTYMNISAFKDKNWYEVLESVLYSYGLVMRYVGNNNVVIYPLRNLPEYGYSGSEELVPIFETGAERELSPAVRRIEESMDYSSSEFVVKLPTTKDLSGSYIEREDENGNKRQCWPLANYQDGQGWINNAPSNTLVVNPQAYSFSSDVNITDEQKQYVYDHLFLRCGLSGGVEYSRFVIPSPVELTFTLGKMIFQSATKVFIAYEDDEAEQWLFPQIKYAISVVQNGITKWLQSDGTFGTSADTLTYKFEEGYNRSVNINVDLSKFNGQALFTFHIKQISGLGGDAPGWLIAIEGLTIQAGGSSLTSNHVNTNYIEENNVILSRNPQITPAMVPTLLPSLIENGIFYKSGDFYYPANKWSWNGNAAQQMAVYNHLQLLCYYAKPNNILTGNIVNADVTDFARIYRWNGTEHIIASGTINLVNGFIENASLREFVRYEDMWGEMTDTSDMPDVESETSSNVQGGTGSTSNASTYSNTTEVNIGGGGTIVLDSYMSDSSTNGVQNRVIKAYIDSENAAQDESITTIINNVLEQGAYLAAMWKLSDDGKNVVTNKGVLIGSYTAIHSGNIGSQSVDAASRLKWNGIIGDANALTKNGIYSFSTATSSRPENYGVLLQLSNKDNPSATDGSSWIYQIAGGTSSTKLYVRQSINGSSWSAWAAIALTSSTVANAEKVGNKALTKSNTANFNGIPYIGSDGLMEVGRYMDFHAANVDSVDYNTRVQLGRTSGSNTITLPSGTGTLALLSDNVGGAKKLVTSGLEDAVTIATDKTASFLGNIKIQPADREDVSLSFISGVESDQFYDYKIGKFTDANAIGGFGIAMANTNGAWVKFLSLTTDTSYNVTSVDFQRALHAKKDAYFSGHMYVGASSNLMLGDKTAGIYITYNAISWHNDSNSYSSSIFGFDAAAIRVYKTLRPNSNSLCALGSSSYRWSGVHAVTGDFSGDVSVKGNLIIMGDVASA